MTRSTKDPLMQKTPAVAEVAVRVVVYGTWAVLAAGSTFWWLVTGRFRKES